MFPAREGGGELDERAAVSIVHLERLTNAAGNMFCQVEGKWRFIATGAISTAGNRSKVGPMDGQGPSR